MEKGDKSERTAFIAIASVLAAAACFVLFWYPDQVGVEAPVQLLSAGTNDLQIGDTVYGPQRTNLIGDEFLRPGVKINGVWVPREKLGPVLVRRQAEQ